NRYIYGDALTNSQANSKLPPRFSAGVARGLREASAISLGVVALVILVALLSFDPRDPGFSSTGLGDGVHNRVGSTGAYLADFLFFLFGKPAYLLPLGIGVAALRLGRGATDAEVTSRANMLVRALGFVVLLLCSCALTGLHWGPGVLRQGAGGVVGMSVGNGL